VGQTPQHFRPPAPSRLQYRAADGQTVRGREARRICLKFFFVLAGLVALTAPAAVTTTAWGGVNGKKVNFFTVTHAPAR